MSHRIHPLRRHRSLPALALISLVLAGCGGGGAPAGPTPPATTYAVGATVSGLVGSGLVLQDNGGDDRSVTIDGTYAFATQLAAGAAYNVTVKTQPGSPAQNCTVTGASGTIAGAAVDATVVCARIAPPVTYTVGGTVSGLAGSGLVLQDNGGDDRAVTLNGNFVFGTALASGAGYAITVKTQPTAPAQTCTVANGVGSVGTANVGSAVVTCVSTPVVDGDHRALSVSLTPLTSAAMGVVAPYVLTEAQGIALTDVSWTYDGQPGFGSSALGVALHVWNTPGQHTLRAVASASNGRTAEATLTLFAVSQPLAGGVFHSCALTAGRGARCWGNGNSGELGNGSSTSSPLPVEPTGLSGLIGLAAGDGHSCAIKGDGSVACWGGNIEGQLGNASTYHGSVNPTPKPVDGLANVISLAAGRYHTCALKADATVACFGQNSENELGTAETASQSVSTVAVAGLSNVVALAAGGGYFTCALKADATVACWGDNESGQLGNNVAAVAQTGTPQTVMTEQGAVLGNVLVLRSGQSHSCAIVADGQNSVWCWGNNGYSQVSSVPGSHYGAVKVGGVSGALMLATTAYSTCVVDTRFATTCWGSNGYGEASGSGVPGANLASPTPFAALQGTASPDYLAGGNEFMCALRADGSASCLGRGGNGQLGNGLSVDAPTLQGVSAAAGTFWHWLGAAL